MEGSDMRRSEIERNNYKVQLTGSADKEREESKFWQGQEATSETKM